ncbi:regulatory LuxR family protein [Solirubrobacter pauli]|uniref:Regulatory LuxR family protein n=1 Tax=Solirubrobacter pauli TaxID=166793 RepID=A0A660LGF8_9ACTN|nr:helix-turn-helix transcriptional regulator [Solirubrobacter pauli]RKQ93010.1 regulatory LuxR family protein [Solirubrobacter pauli]
MAPLVGRASELQEAAAALRAGSVVVIAPAGEGKSRLAREALAAEAAGGAFTAWVQATRSAAAIPLAAFVGLLPEDARVDDVHSGSLDALRKQADGRRIVLAVDDAPRLDPVSAALVLHLAEREVCVLATVRSGEALPDAIAAVAESAHRIELGPLDPVAVDAFVEGLLGGPADEMARHWVRETSGGNALYVEELVSGAVESGALSAAHGLWRLTGKPSVSTSLRELLTTRLEDLDSAQRAPLELLSLCEPLAHAELTALTSPSALRDVEQRGLVALEPDGAARLGHPLFGEVVAGTLPVLRGRRLRVQLADALERRSPRAPGDTLRVARLRLDAGAELPDVLRLDAAEAANGAGDPDLAAELVAPVAGLRAAMALARAHILRNGNAEAEAVLARAEPLAPGEPLAFPYVQQRAWNLTWKLRRLEDAVALLDRALTWSPDPAWTGRVALARRMETAINEGYSVVAELEPALADPTLPDGERFNLEAFAAMSALFAGDGETAAAIALRTCASLDPDSPLGVAAFAVAGQIEQETGEGAADMRAQAVTVLRARVRRGDHDGAALAATALGYRELMRGRYRDAALHLAEAETHAARHDHAGVLLYVRAYQVGVASALGDFEGAQTAMAGVDAALGGGAPLARELPQVLRARGWAARLRSDAEAGDVFVAGAAQIEQLPVHSAHLLYEALRCGVDVAAELRAATARSRSRLVAAFAAHAAARAHGDGPGLLAVAEQLAGMERVCFAMEAATEAAARFLDEARHDSARRAAARAAELHQPDQGTEPPVIDGLDAPAVALTPREQQIVQLVRRGLSNPQIAERLAISVRTVENLVYRAMIKSGVSDRRRL